MSNPTVHALQLKQRSSFKVSQPKAQFDFATTLRNRTGIALVLGLCLTIMLPAVPSHAQSVARGSQALSNASGLSAAGSGLVVAGSLTGIQGSAQMVVESIQRTGDVVVIVLRGVSDAAIVSVQVAASSIAITGLAVGTSIIVVAEATGHALRAGAQLITYVPNEYGASMVYQARHAEMRK